MHIIIVAPLFDPEKKGSLSFNLLSVGGFKIYGLSLHVAL
jgi:hypothetical protein